MYICLLDRRRQLKLFIHLNVTFWGERYRKKVFVFLRGAPHVCFVTPNQEMKQNKKKMPNKIINK